MDLILDDKHFNRNYRRLMNVLINEASDFAETLANSSLFRCRIVKMVNWEGKFSQNLFEVDIFHQLPCRNDSTI